MFCLRENNKTWSSLDFEKNTVRLHINLNTICNNKCPYCYARADKNTWGLIMSNEYIDKILFPSLEKLYSSLQKQNKHLDIVLLGGEPTLHPRFNEILSFLSEKNIRISITSNGKLDYKKIKPHPSIRWAFTYHPSQIHDTDTWFKKINENKEFWWEIAISPLIDTWQNPELYSQKTYNLIEQCHKNNIKVQPTFQFNPYLNDSHIDMTLVEKYYSYLNDEYPIYQYNSEYLNDYQILIRNLNYLKNCTCINNNIQITVNGIIRQCCTNIELQWSDLEHLNTIIRCPLSECTCYGFLSLYKFI